MRAHLIGMAALAAVSALGAFAAPAGAQSFAGSGFNEDDRDRPAISEQFYREQDRRDRRRHRGFDGAFLYPPDYQGNSAWRSDGFNDWWHERTLRSTPRWVFSNQDCARRYWQGGGWRC